MKPERYEEVTRLFQRVVDLDETAREAELDRACVDDPELRSEVEALLAVDAAPPLPFEAIAGDSIEESASDTQIGRYRVTRCIGEGGMGRVLEGVDESLGRPVAIKVLRHGLDGRPEYTRRFLHEARIGGQLEHPGIVPVYEVDEDGSGRPYFTMRCVYGQTLAELMDEARQREGRDQHRLLSIFGRICDAVAYAHSRGVIHRDLKPDNVVIGAFGEVQILDWGLARARSDPALEPGAPSPSIAAPSADDLRTRATSVLGTPAYMPPEQARSEHDHVDQRSDVFALGAILCEILTGAPAYRGDTYDALGAARAHDLEDALTRLSACGADADIVALAKRCLAPEQEHRPETAEPVARAVEQYLSSVEERSQQARIDAETARIQAVEERRARRLTLALSAAVLLIITIVGAGYLWIRHDAEQRTRRATAQVNAALEEVALARGQALASGDEAAVHWAEARSSVMRAMAAVQDGSVPRDIVAEVRQTKDLVERETAAATKAAERRAWQKSLLESIDLFPLARESTIPTRTGKTLGLQSSQEYERIFVEHGLDFAALEVDDAVTAIREAGVGEPLLQALELWAMFLDISKKDDRLEAHVRDILEAADPDPLRRKLSKLARKRNAGPEEALELCKSIDLASATPFTIVVIGEALKSANSHPESAELYRRAHRYHPQDWMLNMRLGLHYKESKDRNLSEARRYLEIAAALRPDSIGTLHHLADVARQQEDWKEAARIYRELARRQPQQAHWHFYTGSILQFDNRPREALEPLSEAIRLNPGQALIWLNRGAARGAIKDYEGAISDFQEAFKRKPTASALINQATYYRKLGKAEEALTCCRRAVALAGPSDRGHFKLGRHFAALDEPDKAIRHFRIAARFGKKSWRLQRDVATNLYELGAEKEALKAALRAARLTRKRSSLFRLIVEIALAAERPEVAEANLIELLKREPDDREARLRLGELLASRGDWIGASFTFREAARGRDAEPEAHSGLSEALWRLGRFDESITHARRAVALDPRDTESRATLAWRLLAASTPSEKSVAEARSLTQQLVETHPANGTYQALRGVAMCRQDQWEEGLRSLKSGLTSKQERSPRFLYWLALAHIRRQDLPAARRVFKEARSLDRGKGTPAIEALRREVERLLGPAAEKPPRE